MPERPNFPASLVDFWRVYFTRSGFPWGTNGWPNASPTQILQSWWPNRDESNVLFLHYQDMLDDLDREMRRVREFLDITVDESRWPHLVKACTFSEMKEAASKLAPVSWPEGYDFFRKGKNRQWQDFATEQDLGLYRAALASLPADLREWLARSE
jgi:aryl sulfotransferase